MRQIQEQYESQLEEYGIPAASIKGVAVQYYLWPIYVLFRDYMQMQMMFRRLAVSLRENGAAMPNRNLLSLHIGGAMHYQSLNALAGLQLQEDSPLSLDNRDDPRTGRMEGFLKGIPFFANHFEEILDNVRIENGDFEINAPFFVRLFGTFLEEESKLISQVSMMLLLSLDASWVPPEAMPACLSSSISVEDLCLLVRVVNALTILTPEDMGKAVKEIQSARRRTRSLPLKMLKKRLMAKKYDRIEGIEAIRSELLSAGTIKEQIWRLLTETLELLCNVYYVGGVLSEGLGDYKIAIADYGKAIAVDPRHTKSWRHLADLLYKTGDIPAAIKAYNYLTELTPDNYHAWVGLGYAILANYRINKGNDLSAGIGAFRRATEIFPKRYPAWLYLAVALKDSGDMAGSAAAYSRAVELASTSSKCLVNIGQVALRELDPSVALDAFRRATGLSPKNHAAWKHLVVALKDSGDIVASENAYKHAVEVLPANVPNLEKVGYAAFKENDLLMAIHAYRRASQLDPTNVRVWNNLGLALYRYGNFYAARKAYETAAELDPTHGDPIMMLGNIHRQASLPASAI
jgi:tetratricopeptide (TPR) repeat protein